MANINVNIHDFDKQFHKKYNFLYDHDDNVAGYREAVDAFDVFCVKNEKFVKEYCKYVGDFISSDREAASFMFALETLGAL